MTPAAGRRALVAVLAAAVVAAGGCGSGGGAKSAASTTTRSGPSLGDAVCSAYVHATSAKDPPSVQGRKALAALATIHPAAADRARFDAVVAAYRDFEHVWTDPATTTPDQFVAASRASASRHARAMQAAGAEPCPRPSTSVTTTTSAAGAPEPSWSFDNVARPTSGDGLWMYFVAACPSGTTVTGVAAPWQPNPGQPGTGYAALVAGLPAGQPFTAVAADAAFAARPPFSGSCT